MGTGQARHRQQAQALEERQLKCELGETCDENPPGQRRYRFLHQGRKPERRADEGQIQQNRCERRHAEAAVGVEQTRGEGGKGNEQYIRKGDAHHLHGERVLFFVGEKSGSENHHQHRCRQYAERRHHQQHRPQGAGHVGGQLANFVVTALALVLAQNRHESLGEGTLGE